MLLSAEAAVAESRDESEHAVELHERAHCEWEAFGNLAEQAHGPANA